MLLAVRTSSYGRNWKALKKLELLSAAPRATLTHLSCSPNFPRASITRYTHAKHEQILNFCIGILSRSICHRGFKWNHTLITNDKNAVITSYVNDISWAGV